MNVTGERAVFIQHTQEIPGSNPGVKTRYSSWGSEAGGCLGFLSPPPRGQILRSRLTLGHDQFVPCHIISAADSTMQ